MRHAATEMGTKSTQSPAKALTLWNERCRLCGLSAEPWTTSQQGCFQSLTGCAACHQVPCSRGARLGKWTDGDSGDWWVVSKANHSVKGVLNIQPLYLKMYVCVRQGHHNVLPERAHDLRHACLRHLARERQQRRHHKVCVVLVQLRLVRHVLLHVLRGLVMLPATKTVF